MVRAKDKLKTFGVKPSKQRGQNFMISEEAIAAIIDFAGKPPEGQSIVEVGPGLGALTEPLSRTGNPLTLIEIEGRFCRDLKRRFPAARIINEDVRRIDFSAIGRDLLVFGNLPYVFSTDIVFHLVANAAVVQRAVLLLQKEFSERMAASPGGRDYGILSVNCQLWADLHLGPVIKGNSFHPPTAVDSRVVELVFLKQPRFAIQDPEWFQKVLKAAFAQRRKKLLNSLLSSGRFSREQILQKLGEIGVDPNCRAETLGMADFVRMAEAFRFNPPGGSDETASEKHEQLE